MSFFRMMNKMFKRKLLIYCYLAFTPLKWFLKAKLRGYFYVKPSTLPDHYIPIHWGQAGEYNSYIRQRHFSSRAIAKYRHETISRNSTATVENLRTARCFVWLWCLSSSCRVWAGLESHFFLKQEISKQKFNTWYASCLHGWYPKKLSNSLK